MMMYLGMHRTEKNGEVSSTTYAMLEKNMKERKKTNRNILEIESQYLKAMKIEMTVKI